MLAELGHEVITVDNDSEKVKLLRAGQIPIHKNPLPELAHRRLGTRLYFSGDIESAVEGSDAVFLFAANFIGPTGEIL